MTVQEAIRMGWAAPDYLVHVWDYVRAETWDLEAKRRWVREWATATKTVVPEKMLTDRALSARIVRP